MLLKTQGKTNLQIQKLLSFKRKGTDNHCGEPTTRALRVLENNKPYRPIKSLQKICVAIPTGLKGEARHMLSCGDRFRRRCIRWWVQENLFYPICNTSQIILLGVRATSGEIFHSSFRFVLLPAWIQQLFSTANNCFGSASEISRWYSTSSQG